MSSQLQFQQLKEATHFGELYSTKKTGGRVYGTRRGPLSIDYQSAVTAETLRMLGKEADMQMKLFHGAKAKRRCDICSKKVKTTRAVSLGEEDYCDHCFRRQYLLCSAIDHFMVPCVQECSIQVPINKRGTKFIMARKMIVNVNLRGLEPGDVRNAHEEFRKFDMESNGWIQKAVLMPVLKACLSLSGVQDRESKFLLNSQALQSTISSYGLDDREEVHEIEFLGLYAFVARERERLRSSINPRARGVFTRNDLEMAYAFRQQMSAPKPGVGHHGNQGAGQPGWEGALPQQRGGHLVRRSQTEGTFDNQRYSSLSPSPSNMAAMTQLSPQPQPPPPQHLGAFPEPVHLFSGHHGNQGQGRQQRQSTASGEYVPLGERLAARRAAVKRVSVVSVGGGGDPVAELAEEDRDEEETLILPPDKDPSSQQRTNSLIGKNNKRQMEDVNKELKLTGGEADSWMMY